MHEQLSSKWSKCYDKTIVICGMLEMKKPLNRRYIAQHIYRKRQIRSKQSFDGETYR
jgi:hypothetical protein